MICAPCWHQHHRYGDAAHEVWPPLRRHGYDEAVNEFGQEQAIAAGGRDHGPPGLRPHYHPHYYRAFVLDPDGHNVEAVCHLPLKWNFASSIHRLLSLPNSVRCERIGTPSAWQGSDVVSDELPPAGSAEVPRIAGGLVPTAGLCRLLIFIFHRKSVRYPG
jgi:hypothetical protein